MAKQITQDTFDDVVRENIQEFEMSPQEALDDAIKQFESQVRNTLLFRTNPNPIKCPREVAFDKRGHSLVPYRVAKSFKESHFIVLPSQ